MKTAMKNEYGQVVLILILVMTVALGIGISVVQRSLSDVSTASKIEQSSRAFSAAEAGIERAIQGFTDPLSLNNNAGIQDVQAVQIPAAEQALEYPPLSKEETATVWLADPSSTTFPSCDTGKICYSGANLGIYWGNAGVIGTDQPAIQITIIYQDVSGVYKSKKYFYDQKAVDRNNGFLAPDKCNPSDAINTSLSSITQKTFFCQKNIDVSSTAILDLSKLILLRARLLYNDTSQSFAVSPAAGLSLPVQANLYTATGVSGETQRKVQVFRLNKVVPSFFDYAIFSAGDINK